MGDLDTAGYRRAVESRNFRFPEDHGPHEGFRLEWWYYTGNLATAEGRPFGYQLTFFRNALTPETQERSSAWGASHAFMAHFAVTDIEGESFHAHERFGREALGLAGAEREPMRVWLEDWEARLEADGTMRLSAAEGEVAISVSLAAGKAPVLQGDAGLSRKGRGEGNASYYYSQTRMPTSGTIRLAGRRFEVTGESWLDREWSTSALEEDQVGWDWFSLQLDDGRELMVYRLRRGDGSADPLSAGTLVEADGSYRRLTFGDWRLEELDSWTSPATGARYPSAWRLQVPGAGIDLELRPLLADQELNHAFRYWEGAVAAEGAGNAAGLRGRGYVEMTGYR
jgi:predicted secreted hydrolase